MRNYFKLTKVLLKSGLGSFGENKKKNGKKKKNIAMIALYLLVAVCMIPVVKMLYDVGTGGYELLRPMRQEGLLIELACYAGALLTFVFGITMVLSVFYLSGDITNLLPLPLKPWEIVGAKFTVALLYDYLTEIVLLGPIFVGYGIASGSGILYWLFVLMAILLVPVMPLVYASVLSMVFMRVFKRANNKDFVTMLSTVLMLIMVFALSSISGSLGGSSVDGFSAEQLLALLNKGNNSLVGLSSKLFPNFRFLARAIVFGDFIPMLLFIGTLIVAVFVFLFLAERLYFASVIGMADTNSRRRRISGKESARINRQTSVLRSCFKKEWRLLMRTPVYFLNTALISIIWPLIMVLPISMSLMANGVDFKGLSFETVSLFLRELFAQPQANGIVLFAFYCVGAFAGIMNYTSGTAISREGSGIYFMKLIPVPYKTQVLAKMLVGIVLGALGSTLYTTLLSIVGILFGMDWVVLPLGILVTLGIVGVQNIIQIAVDLTIPKLNWESEQMAVKQNMNPLIEMLINTVVGVAIGFGAFLLYTSFGLPAYGVAAIGILLLAVCNVAGYVLLSVYAKNRLTRLDG